MIFRLSKTYLVYRDCHSVGHLCSNVPFPDLWSLHGGLTTVNSKHGKNLITLSFSNFITFLLFLNFQGHFILYFFIDFTARKLLGKGEHKNYIQQDLESVMLQESFSTGLLGPPSRIIFYKISWHNLRYFKNAGWVDCSLWDLYVIKSFYFFHLYSVCHSVAPVLMLIWTSHFQVSHNIQIKPSSSSLSLC